MDSWGLGNDYMINRNRQHIKNEISGLYYPIDANAPVTQASGMTFSNWTRNSMTVSWTRGSGSKILLVAYNGYIKMTWTASYTIAPQAGDVYYHATYGYLRIIKVVPGSYICGMRDPAYILSAASYPTTGGATWSRIVGNGDATITTTTPNTHTTGENTSNPLPIQPKNGVNYTADSANVSGSKLGYGSVVYIGTGTSVNVTGLLRNTLCMFMAYEFNDSGSTSPKYNLTPLIGGRMTSN